MSSQPQKLVQSSTLPPAQPSYILRGHSVQIHAIHFLRRNTRLLTGDADGWAVLWSTPTKRPVAVWRAHRGSVLGVGSWGDDRLITQGRDGKLHVWQIREEDEAHLSKILPIDDSASERVQPWILHTLQVHALNFCSFAMCGVPSTIEKVEDRKDMDEVLIATPHIQDGFVVITTLPSEKRVTSIPTPPGVKTGMLMAVGMGFRKNDLQVFAGYESGHASVWNKNTSSGDWQAIYVNQSHSQPILSLDIAQTLGKFYTSSADAAISRHPGFDFSNETAVIQTKHAGQQALTVRSDERIFATAGWDGRIRVYSAKTMKELAVLKWHKEGCYALALAEVEGGIDVSTTASEQPNDSNAGRRTTVSTQRVARAEKTHWLAAGSKDGKISLWDVY